MKNSLIGAGVLALCLGAPAAQAAVSFAFDPHAAGLAGAGDAFTADALKGSEVSVIVNDVPGADGSFAWHEHGYMQVTGARLGGASASTPGLNSAYTLYLAFDVTGVQPNLASGLPGYSTSSAMELFGVTGASTFSIDATGPLPLATVDNGANAPVDLAGLTNSKLTSSGTIVSYSPLALDLSATLDAGFSPTSSGAPAFGFPGGPIFAHGDFRHDSSGVDVLYGGGVFVITGGDDTVTFAVPEPATLTLLGFGLAGLASRRRRA